MNDISENIDKLVKSIVDLVHPLQIILFGSWARGDNSPDSDIDLLVVMPEGTHSRSVAQSIYLNIRGIGVPYDVIITTHKILNKHRDNIGLIYHTILKEGKTVYVQKKDQPRKSTRLVEPSQKRFSDS
jgi:predicted nucleotidyltransferase